MDTPDLARRFTYHPAIGRQRQADHETVRSLALSLATDLDGFLPPGREKSVAMTKLEEVMFWANAALARSPE